MVSERVIRVRHVCQGSWWATHKWGGATSKSWNLNAHKYLLYSWAPLFIIFFVGPRNSAPLNIENLQSFTLYDPSRAPVHPIAFTSASLQACQCALGWRLRLRSWAPHPAPSTQLSAWLAALGISALQRNSSAVKRLVALVFLVSTTQIRESLSHRNEYYYLCSFVVWILF